MRAMTLRPLSALATLSVTLTLVAACGAQQPAVGTDLPAEPSRTVPSTVSAPSGTLPPSATSEPIASSQPSMGSSSGGSGVVRIAGETYELMTGVPPVCSLGFGVQASMASADRRESLDLYVAGSAVGAFLFARPLDGELWMPADNPPPPFQVSGSTASWSGLLRESESSREEDAQISIDCDVDPPPPEPIGGDPAPGGARIVLELGGRSINLPNVALCDVTDEQVEISASATGGTAGVVVSWRADQPPEQTIINYVDLGSALTLVAGPDVSADSPPQVVVNGDEVEITGDVHDPATGRPSQTIRIVASCPPTPPQQPAPPTAAPAGAAGRASVTLAGTDYTFEVGELCEIGDSVATVSLTDVAGNSFDLIVMGQTGFVTISASGEQWVAGLSGEPVRPAFSGSTASWSGQAVETFSQREAGTTFTVECET